MTEKSKEQKKAVSPGERFKRFLKALLKQKQAIFEALVNDWDDYESRKEERHLRRLAELRAKSRKALEELQQRGKTEEKPPTPFDIEPLKTLREVAHGLHQDKIAPIQQELKEIKQQMGGHVTDSEYERLQAGFAAVKALVDAHYALKPDPILEETKGFLAQVLANLDEFRAEIQPNRPLFEMLCDQLRKMENATVGLQKGS